MKVNLEKIGLKNHLKNMKIYNKLPNTKRGLFGNILIEDDNLYWEIPTTNSFAVVLFERQLLTLIASVSNEIYNLDTLVKDLNVYLNTPDDKSNKHVVLPHTLFAESKSVNIDTHYTHGHIQLYPNYVNHSDFCSKFTKSFHALLVNFKNRECEL